MKSKYSLILCVMATLPAWSQSANDSLMSLGHYQMLDQQLLFLHTNNAAGLAIDASSNRGTAAFRYTYDGGHYRRVQEGMSTHALHFVTESYQKLSKWLYVYGKFDFNTGRTKENAWADVMRPYNSNPYFAGSSRAGRYDFQNIKLSASVGTTQIGAWNFGAKLDYAVGDLSRLRDPRSRAELLNYRITPSLLYHFGQQAIGLSGWYDRRKEKINGLTTVQQDANLKYYLMAGMEHAVGTLGGFSAFQREWVNHTLGTELSWYAQTTDEALRSLTTLTLQRGSESVLGQYKYRPGHYYSYDYGFTHQTLIRTQHLLHRIDLGAQYEEAYANEYRPQLVITTAPATGISSYRYDNQLTFKKRYQVKVLNANAHYRLSTLETQGKWGYTGGLLTYQMVTNRYLLPTSELQYRRFNAALEMGGSCHAVTLNVQGGYSFSTRSRLDLADVYTDYAREVLLPDMRYYSLNYAFGHVDVAYEHPFAFKNYRAKAFIKGWIDAIATAKYRSNNYHQYQMGVSLGVVY